MEFFSGFLREKLDFFQKFKPNVLKCDLGLSWVFCIGPTRFFYFFRVATLNGSAGKLLWL